MTKQKVKTLKLFFLLIEKCYCLLKRSETCNCIYDQDATNKNLPNV